jgi:hypothetical protein
MRWACLVANAEDRVPILLARRQTTATAYAWAVALTGAAAPAPLVTPVRVTAADDTALWPGSAAAARITHAGRTYPMIANPTGQPLKAGSWSGTEKLAVVPHN